MALDAMNLSVTCCALHIFAYSKSAPILVYLTCLLPSPIGHYCCLPAKAMSIASIHLVPKSLISRTRLISTGNSPAPTTTTTSSTNCQFISSNRFAFSSHFYYSFSVIANLHCTPHHQHHRCRICFDLECPPPTQMHSSCLALVRLG